MASSFSMALVPSCINKTLVLLDLKKTLVPSTDLYASTRHYFLSASKRHCFLYVPTKTTVLACINKTLFLVCIKKYVPTRHWLLTQFLVMHQHSVSFMHQHDTISCMNQQLQLCIIKKHKITCSTTENKFSDKPMFCEVCKNQICYSLFTILNSHLHKTTVQLRQIQVMILTPIQGLPLILS